MNLMGIKNSRGEFLLGAWGFTFTQHRNLAFRFRDTAEAIEQARRFDYIGPVTVVDLDDGDRIVWPTPNEIKPGDRVRSYDFEGRRDCYVEGVVVEIVERGGCDRYAINVERIVFADKSPSLGRANLGNIYPPVNGTPKLFGGICNGVEKLA